MKTVRNMLVFVFLSAVVLALVAYGQTQFPEPPPPPVVVDRTVSGKVTNVAPLYNASGASVQILVETSPAYPELVGMGFNQTLSSEARSLRIGDFVRLKCSGTYFDSWGVERYRCDLLTGVVPASS